MYEEQEKEFYELLDTVYATLPETVQPDFLKIVHTTLIKPWISNAVIGRWLRRKSGK